MQWPKTPSPIIKLEDELFESRQIEVFLKRDDLIHPFIIGNKWRKLKYNFDFAIKNKFKEVLTFGGAYSNHILATAAAGKLFGINTTGIIRGHELNNKSNDTLMEASAFGMNLHFVTRAVYHQNKMGVSEDQDSRTFLLPEGGTNDLAIKGVAELVDEIDVDFDNIVVPIGTGGTVCGIIKGLKGAKNITGFSVFKGGSLKSQIQYKLECFNIKHKNFKMIHGYHFGGFAKIDQTLTDFIYKFNNKFKILLDPIYTGKTFFGVWDIIKKRYFKEKTRILLLHTGGIQGLRGYPEFSALLNDL